MTLFELSFFDEIRTKSNGELLAAVGSHYADLSEVESVNMLAEDLPPVRRHIAHALLELERRIEARQAPVQVRNSQDMYKAFAPVMSGLIREEIWILLLSQSGHVRDVQRISTGGIATAAADIRLILKKAIERGAPCIALAHNHPSGSVNPSREDNNLTDKLKKAAEIMDIRLLDHLIIGHNTYYSYVDEGLI